MTNKQTSTAIHLARIIEMMNESASSDQDVMNWIRENEENITQSLYKDGIWRDVRVINGGKNE